MGVMDMFKSMVSPTPQTQQPTGQGNIPAGVSPSGTTSNGTAPNGVIPPENLVTTEPKTPSPLDQHAKLWETDPTTKEDPNANTFANVDPQKIMEAASKTDFSKVISAETMAAINAGGEGAITAMMEAMGKMSQSVYAQSALAATKIVSQALEQSEARAAASLPNKIKSQQVSESLRAQNSALTHPAAQPILNAIEIQMTNKFPNATAAEITTLAQDYLRNFAASVTPATAEPNAAKQQESKSTDFSDWI